MKRIDRLILGELAGPWIFGVAIFTVLIMTGTVLFKLNDYIVAGVPGNVIARFTFLLLPGILVKTFSMAVLLATLLAFGRLSSDSEIVAMKASGASVVRMMAPVGAFGLAVAVLTFWMNERVVPWASFQGETLKDQIEKGLQGGKQPTFNPIFIDGKLKALVMAKDFSLRQKSLDSVTITTFNDAGEPTSIVLVPHMTYSSQTDWKLGPGAMLLTPDGRTRIKLGTTYPVQEGVPKPPKPEDIQASIQKDLDVFSMAQMLARIKVAEANPSFDPGQLANLKYGYYNKIALPLATIIFALVGAPLGIRSHRAGTATGFWLSVLIIFAYMELANMMNIYAMGGVIAPYVASFTPIVIGFVFAIVLIIRKNL